MSPAESPDAEAQKATTETPDIQEELEEVMSSLEKLDAKLDELAEEISELEEVEELTEEEHEVLAELKRKKDAHDTAQAKLKHLVGQMEDQMRQRDYRDAPRLWVYVRHVGRSAANRASRRARAGHRRQGVLLDNGLRIRKRGRQRLTKLNLKEFVQNHERLFHYLDNCMIEVIDPKTLKVISREDLLGGLRGLAGEFGKKIKVGDPKVPYALVSGLKEKTSPPLTRPDDATLDDIDTSAVTASVDQANAMRDGEGNPPPSETGNGEPDAEVDTEEADAGQVQDAPADTEVDAPDGLPPAEEGTEGEEPELDVLAKELDAMNRKELDKLAAKEYGLKDAKKLPNKQAVIEAIITEVGKEKE